MKLSHLTRRDFTKLSAASSGMLSAGIGPWVMADSTRQNASRLVDVDFKALISRSDLHYLSSVEKSVEGQPIGNGRMGTMVWTTPSAISPTDQPTSSLAGPTGNAPAGNPSPASHRPAA